ncbi:MAG: hypothetical protein LBJ64_03585 [Deltaproteobacteria bacterium]|nr:hypothetical protein [Deltaproteobacteria bacterium]
MTEVVANGGSLKTVQTAAILCVRLSRARLIIGELVPRHGRWKPMALTEIRHIV